MTDRPVYVASGKLRVITGCSSVSDSTLRSWANANLVRCARLPGGKRLYHLQDILGKLGLKSQPDDVKTTTSKPSATKISYIYARVSSSKQKTAGDLTRQIEAMQQAYPNHQVIKDVASGLNYKRKGLQTILERCLQGLVAEVVVSDRDRLARFGVELLEWLFSWCKVRFVVQASVISETTTSTQELADDLLAVCNFFVARNNGRRAKRNNERRRAIADADQSAHGGDQDGPDATTDVEEVDGSGEVHL